MCLPALAALGPAAAGGSTAAAGTTAATSAAAVSAATAAASGTGAALGGGLSTGLSSSLSAALASAAVPAATTVATTAGGAAGGASALMQAAQIASLIGGGVSAAGSYQQGRFMKKVGENNAETQKGMKRDAFERGEMAEHQHRLKVARLKSQQRAAMGASGVDLTSDTSIGLLEDTAEMGELDALTIRSNAQREGYGYDVAASNSLANAKMAGRSGNFGAATTLLGSAGSVSRDWAMFNRGVTNPLGVQ